MTRPYILAKFLDWDNDYKWNKFSDCSEWSFATRSFTAPR